MEISVVILSEEEVRQAVALWLKLKMTPAPTTVSQVKPIRHKRKALVYAVSVQVGDVDGVDDAGDYPIAEEG
jgi:hypothetical protein